MTAAALQALLSHWRRHPVQFLTLVVGLALATALWSGVQAINAEARASYDRAAAALGGDRAALVSETGTIPQQTYVTLRRAGWQVTPVVDGWISTAGGRVRLLGVDPLTAPADLVPGEVAPRGAAGSALHDFLTPPGRLLAAPATAERIRGGDLPPVAAVDGLAPGIALADIGIAQNLLGREGELSRLVLLDAQPRARAPLAEIAPGLARREGRSGRDLAGLTDSFHLNLTAFGFLSFAVGLLIVHGAIGLAFEQRRPMLRTLRALGLSARRLTALSVAELMVIALVAGLAGTGLGYGIAAALLPDVAATLRGLYGVPAENTLHLRPAWWLAGLGIAALGTALAAAGSIWRTARLPVLAPARPRAWARATAGTILVQLGGALACALAALAFARFGTGLIAGFAVLGGLLLGAALALPALLSGLLALAAARARTPIAQWFWADTRQQLPGLSLALMALLLALAANIGVGSMVASFRLTFTGWLDQRLFSELYVVASDETQATRLRAWLAPRVDAVLPIWHVDRAVLGAPAEIYGVADHASYRTAWPILDAVPDVWDRVAAGTDVLVNEQLARRAGLAPGDALAMPGGWTARIGGIYSDYGNPLGQVFVGLDTFTRHYPEGPRLRFGLRLPEARIPALTEALTAGFGLAPGQITEQASLKAASLAVFERTFAVTGALNVLTLAVAGFAIFTSLLTLAAMRVPQLAPVWALGVTRARLARLELARALILAALTVALAIPTGLGLAFVLLTVINVEAFGWRLPMHLFPRDWAVLGGLALIAAGAASLWPALRLARTPPARLLGVFAHER